MFDLLLTVLSIFSRNNIKILDDKIINLLIVYLLFRLLNAGKLNITRQEAQASQTNSQKDTPKERDEECKSEISSLSDLIRKKFRGSRITVVLQSGVNIAGEVLYGSGNILVLKAGSEIHYINPVSIVSIS